MLISFAVMLMLCTLFVNAQSRVEFLGTEHNFETIKEDGGDVNCEFVVKNISSSPVVIRRVTTNCSCIITKYSRQPIMPQGVDTLRVSFDPRFRAGILQKSLSVYFSGDTIPRSLTLRGYVAPSE